MGRRNKINGQMAFAAIQGKLGSAPEYEHFLNLDVELGIEESDDLKKVKDIYREYLNDIKTDVNVMAQMEEVISQLRSREMVSTEIRLSIQSNYVYARSTFYRRRFEPNEIRSIIGRTDIVGDDVNELIKNKEFMDMAVHELKYVMSEEITETFEILKQLLWEKRK